MSEITVLTKRIEKENIRICTFFMYAPSYGKVVYEWVRNKDGVWINKDGKAPLCWLDFEGCDTRRNIEEIVKQAHENSGYQFADDEYIDKRFYLLDKKLPPKRNG